MLVTAEAVLTVMRDVEMLEISATAVVLLSLMTQNGTVDFVPLQFIVDELTLDPVTNEPLVSVELAVMELHPVPHVGAEPNEPMPPLTVSAVEPNGTLVPIPTFPRIIMPSVGGASGA